mgnify:CR=1 FL=1
MTSYIVDYLKTDLGFSKLLYKYLLMNDQISGQDLCLVLYEQGVLSKEDEAYSRLASGELNSYDFMINKIANLEIEPAQLALKPCSASAVVTDVNTERYSPAYPIRDMTITKWRIPWMRSIMRS